MPYNNLNSFLINNYDRKVISLSLENDKVFKVIYIGSIRLANNVMQLVEAAEHLKDFTKFPTFNDIVLLMEEHAMEIAIGFNDWVWKMSGEELLDTMVETDDLYLQYQEFLKE
jgi:hypothetical protein